MGPTDTAAPAAQEPGTLSDDQGEDPRVIRGTTLRLSESILGAFVLAIGLFIGLETYEMASRGHDDGGRTAALSLHRRFRAHRRRPVAAARSGQRACRPREGLRARLARGGSRLGRIDPADAAARASGLDHRDDADVHLGDPRFPRAAGRRQRPDRAGSDRPDLRGLQLRPRPRPARSGRSSRRCLEGDA